jgi:hypothetical protein
VAYSWIGTVATCSAEARLMVLSSARARTFRTVIADSLYPWKKVQLRRPGVAVDLYLSLSDMTRVETLRRKKG